MKFFFRNKNKELNTKTKQLIFNLFWESLLPYTKLYSVTLPTNIQN